MRVNPFSGGFALALALAASLMVPAGAQGQQAHSSSQATYAIEITHTDRRVHAPGRASCAAPSAQAAREVLAQHNRLRAQQGMAPLRHDPLLSDLAAQHACDMARRGVVTHRGADGASAGQRARRGGYAWLAIAENLAAGRIGAGGAAAAWHASPGHLANVTDRRMRDYGIGFAVAADGRTTYWAALYAAPQ
ncbi:MAG: CAP domain-containing protein [Paracoccus sp. (in: a-proteobacteria)]|nr:CAP domain-containing protein [Paracoccus sp. (in: a-proteobacteria)]